GRGAASGHGRGPGRGCGRSPRGRARAGAGRVGHARRARGLRRRPGRLDEPSGLEVKVDNFLFRVNLGPIRMKSELDAMNDPRLPSPSRRRLLGGAVALAAGAVAFPMIATGRHRIVPALDTMYSTRAIDLVRESLVIDMLAPLKIDFRPEYYASRISEQDAEEIRASGITGFHHAVGLGGPNAHEAVLEYMAAWSGFVGRNSHVFTLVGE